MKTLEAKSLQDLRSRLDRLEAQSGQSGQSGPERKEQFVGKCVNIQRYWKGLKKVHWCDWLFLYVFSLMSVRLRQHGQHAFQWCTCWTSKKQCPKESRNRSCHTIKNHPDPSRVYLNLLQAVPEQLEQSSIEARNTLLSKLEWLAEVWKTLSSVLETWITIELSYTCHRCRGKVLAAFEQQIGPAWGTIRARHENIATCCEGIFRYNIYICIWLYVRFVLL